MGRGVPGRCLPARTVRGSDHWRASGAHFAKAPQAVQKHLGWCLLPQSGVALGLALLASDRLPDVGERLLPMIIATTVCFEVMGPVFTQRHLRMAGEAHSLRVRKMPGQDRK